MSGFHVDTSELTQWSADVTRQANYMVDVSNFSSRNLSDTDFGRILSLITESYGPMVTQFVSLLQQCAKNLGQEHDALNSALTGYKHEEARTRAHLDTLLKVPSTQPKIMRERTAPR